MDNKKTLENLRVEIGEWIFEKIKERDQYESGKIENIAIHTYKNIYDAITLLEGLKDADRQTKSNH